MSGSSIGASDLPGHLPGDEASQARLPQLEEKLARLASFAPVAPK